MYTVYEYPRKCCSFPTLQEAIDFIVYRKPGVRDCCWIEDDNGNIVYRGQ
jgi:hypothetical protein